MSCCRVSLRCLIRVRARRSEIGTLIKGGEMTLVILVIITKMSKNFTAAYSQFIPHNLGKFSFEWIIQYGSILPL
jgi:hypothetical protein